MASWLQTGNISKAKDLIRNAQAERPIKTSVTLSMYSDLPDGEVAIEEFERYAMDRLRVLKGIENARAKGFRPDQVHAEALKLADAHLAGSTREEAARKDTISHYVLRLAYCRTDELRRWFLSQECDLFKARFCKLLPDEQRAFMAVNNMPFRQLSVSELDGDLLEQLKQTLKSVTQSVAAANAAMGGGRVHESFCKVPFEMVPDLVATRKVFLKGGLAYVSRDQLVSLVVQPFRSNLSKALAVTARRWSAVVAPNESDRLAPIVEGLSQRYLGPDYTDPEKRGVVGAVMAADIPAISRQSFPLCMLSIYQSLHETHELKHEGRQQLGLFLKGIGLPLEEAIRFWRMEFAHKAPGDKFDKQYLYNIRHRYGKEGNRKDYTPYSCLKVISTTPGVGQVHGCPYKTFSPDNLRAALSRLQVAPAKVDEAVAKARAGHYQLACAAVWEGKHGCACDSGINHPNQYYEESRKALGASTQGPGGGAAEEAQHAQQGGQQAAGLGTAQMGSLRGNQGGEEEGGGGKHQRTG